MAGVLLDQVEQDPLEGCRAGSIPSVAGLTRVSQVVGLDDRPASGGLDVQRCGQLNNSLVGGLPPSVLDVGPRPGDIASFEPPFQPAELGLDQVLEQLDRRPPGRQSAAPQLIVRQAVELAQDA